MFDVVLYSPTVLAPVAIFLGLRALRRKEAFQRYRLIAVAVIGVWVVAALLTFSSVALLHVVLLFGWVLLMLPSLPALLAAVIAGSEKARFTTLQGLFVITGLSCFLVLACWSYGLRRPQLRNEPPNRQVASYGPDGRLRSLANYDFGKIMIVKGLAGREDLAWRAERSTTDPVEDLKLAPNLLELVLDGAEITDADLVRLSYVPRLKRLGIRNAAITNDGLAALANLSDLQDLELTGPAISDDSLPELLQLSSLGSLSLAGTRVTDAGLQQLAQLGRLWRLDLSKTSVTGHAFCHTADFASLQDITLRECPVDDAGLQCVLTLPNLKRVIVHKTKVTPEALTTIRQELKAAGRHIDFY